METNPETEVTQSPEDQLEAVFAKQYNETPEEAEPEVEEVETEAVEEDQAEETTESFEEVEYEGKQYQLPKELKEAVLRQQDYTRKTQEVADKRRQVEEREAFIQQREQIQQAIFPKQLEVHQLEAQLQQYENLDWAALADSDPNQVLKLDLAHRQLQAKHQRAKQELNHVATEAQRVIQQQRLQQRAKLVEDVKREIPNYTPELDTAIFKTAREYGAPDNLPELVDQAWMVKALVDLHKYAELQKSKGQIAKKIAGAKPVKVTAARTSQTSQQATQIQDAKARLRKSGKTADAESYLEGLFRAKGMK